MINKTDLAPHVGADVEGMLADAAARRDDLPVLGVALTVATGAADVAAWIRLQRSGFAEHGHLHTGVVGLRSITTITITHTEVPGAALLAVARDGAGQRVTRLRPGARATPRILRRGPDAVHAVLVPTQAGPLSGTRSA